MCDGAVAGFKYFDLRNSQKIRINIKGNASGLVTVRNKEGGSTIARIQVSPVREVHGFTAELSHGLGEKEALFFSYEGKGSIDFFSFALK